MTIRLSSRLRLIVARRRRHQVTIDHLFKGRSTIAPRLSAIPTLGRRRELIFAQLPGQLMLGHGLAARELDPRSVLERNEPGNEICTRDLIPRFRRVADRWVLVQHGTDILEQLYADRFVIDRVLA